MEGVISNMWTAVLPGLYLLILGGGLWWALQRWFKAPPWSVTLVFALLLVALFGRALFLGEVLLPLDNLVSSPPFQHLLEGPPNRIQGDVVREVVPWQSAVRRFVRAGEWPLWNPFAGAGMTLLGNPQGQVGQPLALLALPLPLQQAAGVVSSVRILVALVFTFLLLRRLGLSEEPALVGSLSYALSGFLLMWLGWAHTNAAALLPLLLFALLVAEDGRRVGVVLLTGVTAAVALGGHPETVFIALSAGAAFAIARALRGVEQERAPGVSSRRSWRCSLRRVMPVTAAMALGLLLAAPVLLPAVPTIDGSLRRALVAAREVSGDSWAAWSGAEVRRAQLQAMKARLLPMAAPNAFGHDLQGAFWGTANIVESGSFFAGSLALFLAASLLTPLAGARRLPGERFFLVATVLMVVLRAQPPGLRTALHGLPVVGSSASYLSRGGFLFCLATAALAAYACQHWRDGKLGARRLIGVAGALGAVILWAYLAHPHPEVPSLLRSTRLGSMALQLAVMSVGVAILIRRHGARHQALLAVAGLMSLELLAFHRPINRSHPREHYYPVVPSIAFLQEHQGGSRVLGLGPYFGPNIPTVFGLREVSVKDPLEPWRYAQLTLPLHRSGLLASQWLLRPQHSLYDLLGVRLVLGRPGLELPHLRTVFRSREAWVWERTGALPLLFLPAEAEPMDASEWPGRVWQQKDFLARSLVPASGTDESWRARDPEGSTLEILAISASQVTGRATATERRLLATGIYQDGGWYLLADGRPTPTLLTNGIMVGAWLEPWARRLDLIYRPRGFVLGCLLSALSLGTLLILTTAPPRV